MVLKAARAVDSSITDAIAQQKWKWIRIRNISLTRCMGKEKDGGLRKLREELEAENSRAHIPAEIRWLGGAKVRARFQEKKDGSSSVVAAVLGEAIFGHLCRYGVRLFGVRYEVDTYEETRPNAFCSRCSGWVTLAPTARPQLPGAPSARRTTLRQTTGARRGMQGGRGRGGGRDEGRGRVGSGCHGAGGVGGRKVLSFLFFP